MAYHVPDEAHPHGFGNSRGEWEAPSWWGPIQRVETRKFDARLMRTTPHESGLFGQETESYGTRCCKMQDRPVLFRSFRLNLSISIAYLSCSSHDPTTFRVRISSVSARESPGQYRAHVTLRRGHGPPSGPARYAGARSPRVIKGWRTLRTPRSTLEGGARARSSHRGPVVPSAPPRSRFHAHSLANDRT